MAEFICYMHPTAKTRVDSHEGKLRVMCDQCFSDQGDLKEFRDLFAKLVDGMTERLTENTTRANDASKAKSVVEARAAEGRAG